jgi:predicted dehydrogenase
MPPPTRAIVVGVGPFGLRHAMHYAALPDVVLAGVVDADPARARAAADALACPAFASLDDAAGAADVASVAVPTPLHAEVAASLLDRGLHVLVEKPLAATVRDAAALVERARSRGRVLEVGLVERFNPAVRAVRALGVRPLLVQATRTGPFPPRAATLDVVTDWMIHDLDLCLHLGGGSVRRVEAAGVPVVGRTLDAASARLWLSGPPGAPAARDVACDLVAVRLASQVRRTLRLVAADAVYELDLAARTVVVTRGRRPAEPIPVIAADPLRDELCAFVAAARGEAPPAIGAEAGRRALELAVQVREAAVAAPVPSWAVHASA